MVKRQWIPVIVLTFSLLSGACGRQDAGVETETKTSTQQAVSALPQSNGDGPPQGRVSGAPVTGASATAEVQNISPAAESSVTTGENNTDIGETIQSAETTQQNNGSAAEALAFIRNMKVGWNLGNTFDASDCTWVSEMEYESAWCGAKTTREMIHAVKEEGFQTIRIPVSWHNHVDSQYRINEAWLNRVEEVVRWAYDEGMYVILDIHHDNSAQYMYPSYDKLDQSKKYVSAIWTQLADRFADYDQHLIFECVNEPRHVGTDHEWWIADTSASYAKEAFDCINQINQAAVDAIRSSGKGYNPERYIMVPGYCASPDYALVDDYRLPQDTASNKLIVSIHAYTPYNFALNSSGTNAFGSGNGTADIDSFLSRLNDKFISRGIPVVIGEWGTLDKNNTADRVEHAAYYVSKAADYGIPTILWDNNAFQTGGENFGYLDRATLNWHFPEIMEKIIGSADL